MSDSVRIAETAMKHAEKVEQTSSRGGILAGLFLMLLAACGISGLLAYFRCDDLVVALSLVLPAGVLGITGMVVRETIRSKQLILLAPEKVIMEAFRHNLVGSRERMLTGDAPPRALEEVKQELANVPLDPHHHKGHQH